MDESSADMNALFDEVINSTVKMKDYIDSLGDKYKDLNVMIDSHENAIKGLFKVIREMKIDINGLKSDFKSHANSDKVES